MPPKAKISGDKTRIEWKRVRWDFGSEQTTATLEGNGLYDQMLKSAPLINGTHKKVPGLKITRITLDPGQTNEGKMVIYFAGPARVENGSDQNTYERDFGIENRPIERHPKAPHLKEDRPYYAYPDRAYNETTNPRHSTPSEATETPVSQRTFDHWAVLDAEDVAGGTWTLPQFKALKESGWNDYEHSYPIASSTIFSNDRPGVASGILDISNPPGNCGAPSGFTYFKTSDRTSKEGTRWRRCQQWEGRRGADADLYALVYG